MMKYANLWRQYLRNFSSERKMVCMAMWRNWWRIAPYVWRSIKNIGFDTRSPFVVTIKVVKTLEIVKTNFHFNAFRVTPSEQFDTFWLSDSIWHTATSSPLFSKQFSEIMMCGWTYFVSTANKTVEWHITRSLLWSESEKYADIVPQTVKRYGAVHDNVIEEVKSSDDTDGAIGFLSLPTEFHAPLPPRGSLPLFCSKIDGNCWNLKGFKGFERLHFCFRPLAKRVGEGTDIRWWIKQWWKYHFGRFEFVWLS